VNNRGFGGPKAKEAAKVFGDEPWTDFVDEAVFNRRLERRMSCRSRFG
jgi:hypothetical protein